MRKLTVVRPKPVSVSDKIKNYIYVKFHVVVRETFCEIYRTNLFSARNNLQITFNELSYYQMRHFVRIFMILDSNFSKLVFYHFVCAKINFANWLFSVMLNLLLNKNSRVAGVYLLEMVYVKKKSFTCTESIKLAE